MTDPKQARIDELESALHEIGVIAHAYAPPSAQRPDMVRIRHALEQAGQPGALDLVLWTAKNEALAQIRAVLDKVNPKWTG